MEYCDGCIDLICCYRFRVSNQLGSPSWPFPPRSAHRLSHASSIKSALLQDIPEGAILVDDKLAIAAAAAIAAGEVVPRDLLIITF